MKFAKRHAAQHDSASLRKAAPKQESSMAAPLRGLLAMLGTCVAFLAFLVAITCAVHFIML